MQISEELSYVPLSSKLSNSACGKKDEYTKRVLALLGRVYTQQVENSMPEWYELTEDYWWPNDNYLRTITNITTLIEIINDKKSWLFILMDWGSPVWFMLWISRNLMKKYKTTNESYEIYNSEIEYKWTTIKNMDRAAIQLFIIEKYRWSNIVPNFILQSINTLLENNDVVVWISNVLNTRLWISFAKLSFTNHKIIEVGDIMKYTYLFVRSKDWKWVITISDDHSENIMFNRIWDVFTPPKRWVYLDKRRFHSVDWYLNDLVEKALLKALKNEESEEFISKLENLKVEDIFTGHSEWTIEKLLTYLYPNIDTLSN